MDVIYLDFEKAFDKAPHRRLLIKTDALDFIGKKLKLIENWLISREQRVIIGNNSGWTLDLVKSGAPQGMRVFPLRLASLILLFLVLKFLPS